MKEGSVFSHVVLFFALTSLAFHISTSVLFSFYLFFGIILISKSKVSYLMQKEIFILLRNNNWKVAADHLQPYMILDLVRDYSPLFFFSSKKQSQFVRKNRLELNNNIQRLQYLCSLEQESDQWEYLISEEIPHISQQIHQSRRYWNLSTLMPKHIVFLEQLSKVADMKDIVKENLEKQNLKFFTSLGLSAEEISEIYTKQSKAVVNYTKLINNMSVEELISKVSNRKRITHLKKQIRSSILVNLDNTLKILNLVYLLDIKIDIALNYFKETMILIWPSFKMFDPSTKRKCLLIKKILKKQYSDQRLLQLFLPYHPLDDYLFSSLIPLVSLKSYNFPKKVSEFHEFKDHLQGLTFLRQWRGLKVDTSSIDSLPRQLLIGDKEYTLLFPKRIEDFKAFGSAMQNCLFTHDYFSKVYDGIHNLIIVLDSDEIAHLAIHLDSSGGMIACLGFKNQKPKEDDRLALAMFFKEHYKQKSLIILLARSFLNNSILCWRLSGHMCISQVRFFINMAKVLIS